VKVPSALILSPDPVASALIAAAAELASITIVFPDPGEGVRDALRRLRPSVVLADCDRDDATSEAFVGPAMMTGARVGIFCSATNPQATGRSRTLAERYDLAFFSLPDDADALHAYLHAVSRDLRGTA